MPFTLSNVRLNGCLLGAPSKKDYRTVFDNAGAVPDRVDLRQYCTAVEDQGQIGSCTANAAVGALEYHLKRRDGDAPDLSRMFVYYNARRMRGRMMIDGGAYIRDAMASVMAFGACREDIWPYDPMLFAMEPSPQAYEDAVKHEALQYARVDSGQGTIRALAKGFPVVFATLIPPRCYEEAARTGVIPPCTASERDQPTTGGHAMLIVGYDNIERVFIVRNSWGEGWGDCGYCRIPYDVMEMCGRPDEFWVVAELTKQEGFTVIRPGRAVMPTDDGENDRTRVQADVQLGGLASTTTKMRDEIRKSLEADVASSARKIDSLLSAKTGTPAVAPPRGSGAAVLPCTTCAGSGICPFCHNLKPGCVRCQGTGACAECGGTGVL
ncbi:MAG: C1 family peptidase [Bacteroidales bacterium]